MPTGRTRSRLAGALALLALAMAGCGRAPGEEPRDPSVELTLSAAASLREAVTELAARYEASHPGTTVRVNLGASGALRQQIEQGARVDVFVSAAVGPMDALAERGLVDTATRADLAGNSLVVVVPRGSAAVKEFRDLASPGVRRVALGAPASVPAGEYALEAMRALGIAAAVQAKAVYAQNVRQVLAYVESGNVDAGIVYATDAAASPRVVVAAAAPPGTHRPIVYPLAVVHATAHPREARALAAFLRGAEARQVLLRRGFRPAPAP
ncbi:MAG TPA: molybdate ABC transporter substrate-binding protein [Longimicrobiaceae bacterium]|nr:molybdate ABC transporter substrate-binding protein [Longimicrobiaceae bacterium]